MRPGVTIVRSNGGLGLQAPSEFGTAAILVAAPVAPVAGYSVPFLIRNKKQAETAFAQVGNEEVLEAILDGYFAEAGEGGKLYVLAMAQTTTLAQLLAAANADPVLNAGTGEIRLVAVIKFPSGAYSPTIEDGFDNDVFAAVTAAQTLSNSWFSQKKPFRALIQGYGFTDASAAKDYASGVANAAAVVVGSIADSTATMTLLALGRAAKALPQQNIGRVKSGSLAIAEAASVKIGSATVELTDDSDLELLHAKRYITVELNQVASGYVFNDDNMVVDGTDDYNNLRYGRVIDNATRVAFKAYYRELKDDVDVDEDSGRLATAVEKALETSIETAINAEMPGQLSKRRDGTADVECLVNPPYDTHAALYEDNNISSPNFNILQTETVYIFLRLKPKGCLKYLNVYLGFTA